MKFEIKKDRGGEPYGRLSYGDETAGKLIEIRTGNLDLKFLLLLIAFFANYIREVI